MNTINMKTSIPEPIRSVILYNMKTDSDTALKEITNIFKNDYQTCTNYGMWSAKNQELIKTNNQLKKIDQTYRSMFDQENSPIKIQKISPVEEENPNSIYSQLELVTCGLKPFQYLLNEIRKHPSVLYYVNTWTENLTHLYKLNSNELYALLTIRDMRNAPLLHYPEIFKAILPLLSRLERTHVFFLFTLRDPLYRTPIHEKEIFSLAMPILTQLSVKEIKNLLITGDEYNNTPIHDPVILNMAIPLIEKLPPDDIDKLLLIKNYEEITPCLFDPNVFDNADPVFKKMGYQHLNNLFRLRYDDGESVMQKVLDYKDSNNKLVFSDQTIYRSVGLELSEENLAMPNINVRKILKAYFEDRHKEKNGNSYALNKDETIYICQSLLSDFGSKLYRITDSHPYALNSFIPRMPENAGKILDRVKSQFPDNSAKRSAAVNSAERSAAVNSAERSAAVNSAKRAAADRAFEELCLGLCGAFKIKGLGFQKDLPSRSAIAMKLIHVTNFMYEDII